LTNFHKIDIFNQQSLIVNQMGGGVGIASFPGEKSLGSEGTLVKYRQSQENDLTPPTPLSRCVFLPEVSTP
jgi:hypothetical protein